MHVIVHCTYSVHRETVTYGDGEYGFELKHVRSFRWIADSPTLPFSRISPQTVFELKAPNGPPGPLQWAWQPAAKGHALLAVGGGDSRVNIYNKDGTANDTLKLKG